MYLHDHCIFTNSITRCFSENPGSSTQRKHKKDTKDSTGSPKKKHKKHKGGKSKSKSKKHSKKSKSDKHVTYTNDINDSGLEEGDDEDDGDNEIIAEVTNANSDVEHNNVTGSDAEIKENGSDFIQKVQEASGDNRTSLDEVNKSDEVPEGNFHSSSKDSGIDQSNG